MHLMNLSAKTTVSTLTTMFPGKALRYMPDKQACGRVIQEMIENESVSNGCWSMTLEGVIASIDENAMSDAIYQCWAENDGGKQLNRLIRAEAEKQAKDFLDV